MHETNALSRVRLLVWQDFRRLGAAADDQSKTLQNVRCTFSFQAFSRPDSELLVRVHVQADLGARRAKVHLESPPVASPHEEDLRYLGGVLQVASDAAHRAREAFDQVLTEARAPQAR